jgi:hypothetical protein
MAKNECQKSIRPLGEPIRPEACFFQMNGLTFGYHSFLTTLKTTFYEEETT